MKISYKLDRNLSCEKICADIQKLISSSGDLSNRILIIDIVNIIDTDINLQPKLEHKTI